METNNKHTAGEWKATGLEIRHANNSMILATVYPHLPLNQSREEAEANAKLIAAAPQLLRMAKVWKSCIDMIVNSPEAMDKERLKVYQSLQQSETYKQTEQAINQATT